MAQLSTQSVNDLPDDAFALVQGGGTKDSSGKTVPRNLRHFPIHDAAHVRNALARLPQSNLSDADKMHAKGKIAAAAKKFGVQVGDSSDDSGRAASLSQADTERRFTPGMCEVRSATDGHRIGGYGAVFGKLSRNLGGFVELVDTSAFNQARTLGWPSIVCRYNHDPNMILGTTPKTLELRTDNVGLDYSVLPPQSRADILELVERGDIRFSSFAFRCPPGGDEWRTTDQNYPMRVLHEVQLVDVSPVLEPAYPDATAGLRSLAAAKEIPVEEVRNMAAADELRHLFVRTDGPVWKPEPKKVSAAAAMMQLMEKRRDPFAGQG